MDEQSTISYVLVLLEYTRFKWMDVHSSVTVREVVAQQTQRVGTVRECVLEFSRHLRVSHLRLSLRARRERGNERRVPAERPRPAGRHEVPVHTANKQTHAQLLPCGRIRRGALLVQNRRHLRVHVAHWRACKRISNKYDINKIRDKQ